MSIESLRSIHKSEDNFKCFECGFKNSTWACTELCIFLCIDCAHSIKTQCGDIVMIKSLSMASWSSEEIEKLRNGGNLRLRSLMIQYGISKTLSIQEKYACKAVEYYKNLLKSEIYHYHPPQAPKIDEGLRMAGEPELTWWGKAKESVGIFAALGDNRIVQGVRENIQGETFTKIKNTGVSAICGLREFACSSIQKAFNGSSEQQNPDYVMMEEPFNRDNNKRK